MNTKEIKDFNEILEIAFKNKNSHFYRGQSSEYKQLIPGIFRNNIKEYAKRKNSNHIEAAIMQSFKTYSSTLEYKLSLPKENEEWLFFAQHNGIATRLLDWSTNILKALFFAVIDDQEDNGEIYTLNFKLLNQISNAPPVFNIEYPDYNFLVEDAFAFEDQKEKLLAKVDIEKRIEFPLGIFPYTIRERRLENQEGIFTIHPSDNYDLVKLAEQKPNIVTRYIIPTKFKKEFESKLAVLGITYLTLFPDLHGIKENLNRMIKYDHL